MRFDFAYFAKALCMIGGILYFQDIFGLPGKAQTLTTACHS